MLSRLKLSITPLVALVAICAAVVGTHAASGEEGRSGSTGNSTTASGGAASADHQDMVASLPVPGIDPEAEAPSVDDLWIAFEEAGRCLEKVGFKFLGPFAGSDGARLLYLVYSPPGGPVLAPSNPCEDPLKTGAAAFERSAPLEARAKLVSEFRTTMTCLGLDADPLTAEEARSGIFDRDLAGEDLVMRELMGTEADPQRCVGRRG